MSHFLERLTYLSRKREAFADGHGELRDEDRTWEEGYRQRWQHDKIVRSTHGVNCTGSCSWKIYVKSGVVTWETQQTDYPRTRPGMPNHEPRGCSRGASYSWYLYSASRIKYPMVRGRLVKAWREARKTLRPSRRGRRSASNPETAKSYKVDARPRRFHSLDLGRSERDYRRLERSYHQDLGTGSRRRLLAYPGDVDGVLRFRGALSQPDRRHAAFLLRLVLRPAAIESADLGRADRRAGIGRLVQFRPTSSPGARTSRRRARPTRIFSSRSRYNGTKVVAITPDYAEVAKLSDLWLHPKQGTDAALAMAMGHVDPARVFPRPAGAIFPGLYPPLHRHADAGAAAAGRRALGAGPLCAPERSDRRTESRTEPTGRPSRSRKRPAISSCRKARSAIAGRARAKPKGAGISKPKDGETGEDVRLALSLIDRRDEVVPVAFPYFGGKPHEHFPENDQGGDVLVAQRAGAPRRACRRRGAVATVFDLLCANYGLDRGLGGACATIRRRCALYAGVAGADHRCPRRSR